MVDDQQHIIETLQGELTTLQGRWKTDRCEAERTIRELLEQLTVLEMHSSKTTLLTPSQLAAPARDAA